MTYIAEKPAVSFTGIERPLITIEFAPNNHKDETEYSYPHPQFVFGDRVSILNTYPELEFTVCALELIESKTQTGKLLSQPRWKYKVTNGQVSFWKDESALMRKDDRQSLPTCSTCSYFDDFDEPSGRGWCQQFNHQARTHHIESDDCVVTTQKVEAFPISKCSDGAKSDIPLGTAVIELDRDGYPMEEAASTGYFATNFVTNSNEPF